MNLALLAALIGIAGACTGGFLPAAQGRTRLLVPLSGAILLAVSLFSILPEMAQELTWARAAALYGCGYAGLFLIDRYVHPVCPSCSHDGLQGFATPLVLATAVHAFVDGWGMTIAQQSGSGSMRTALPVAVLLHKIPEGLALGVMLRAALPSASAAAAWGSAAELSTAVGAIVAITYLPGVNPAWSRDLLALAGGTFLYLGIHAVHGGLRELRR